MPADQQMPLAQRCQTHCTIQKKVQTADSKERWVVPSPTALSPALLHRAQTWGKPAEKSA